MTTLYFIRHGQIDANVQRLWHGSTDSQLNTVGQQQATRMASHVKEKYPLISNIYASPLRRTLKTAEALGSVLGHKVQGHAGLREFGVGEWEGKAYDLLMSDYHFLDSMAANQDFAPEGGDSVNAVCKRMLSAIEEIKAKHTGQHVAIVGHGAAIAIALSKILNGAAFPFYDFHMDNTGISVLHWQDEPSLVSFNKTEHLSAF